MDDIVRACRRSTFVDPDLQAQFSRDGYVVIREAVDDAVTASLRESFHRIHPDPGTGFVPTYAGLEPERKRADAEAIRSVLEPPVVGRFEAHRVFFTSFLMKWPGDDSGLYLHQDWSYVDEDRYRTAVVWVAVDDASAELDNGPLRVLPGSHRMAPDVRGTRTPLAFDGLDEHLEPHLVTVPVARGDAVVLDNGLVHCSSPNRSSHPRLAVAMAVAPVEADLCHTVDDGDGGCTTYTVDEAFFLDQTPETMKEHGMPAAYPPREVAAARYHPLDATALARRWGAPAADVPAPERPAVDRLLERVVVTALRADARLVRLAADEQEPVLDGSRVEWVVRLEDGFTEMQQEAEALLAGGVQVPLIEDAIGRSQGNDGVWRAFVFVAHGDQVEFNAARCPRTAALVAGIPGLQSALFSILEPGAHLPLHRGPNKGVLRYHLPLVVPDPVGAAGLRVDGRVVAWQAGHSVLFDDTYEHEAWNEADGPRLSLLLEVIRPLEGAVGAFNRLTQRLFGLYPEARGAQDRLDAVEWALNGGLPRG